MKRINIKHNYVLPHFIQFSKHIFLFIDVEGDNHKQPFAQENTFEYYKIFKKIFFHRPSPVAASGHLHVF